MNDLPENWRRKVFEILQRREDAEALREAALRARLKAWTASMTATTVESFEAMGYCAAARGHQLERLPVSRSEYLSLDVIAFPKNAIGWCFPVAAVELENSRSDDQVAYSLWKVLCIRSDLRAVFCYREDADEANALVRRLRDQVIGAMGLERRVALEGDTLVVVGTRGEVATFPYGFFKWWRLDKNTGRFGLM